MGRLTDSDEIINQYSQQDMVYKHSAIYAPP